MENFSVLYEAILNGQFRAAHDFTQRALAEGADPLALVNQAMVPAMDEAGQRFEKSEYFVPELLMAARAMKAALELIRPLLVARGEKMLGKVVIGTVKGDMHDIGKNLVSAMLEGGGFEVIDLGVNVTPEKFIETARQNNAHIVAISALLTTTMPFMKKTIDAFAAAGVRDQVKVLIGGAPVTQKYADEIGADGFGENAVSAVAAAKRAMAALSSDSGI